MEPREYPSFFKGSEALAVRIGTNLLQGERYARLSVEDLSNYGALQPGQRYVDLVTERLGFNRPLAPEAFNNLIANLPNPVDGQQAKSINLEEIIPPELEAELRDATFNGKSNDIVQPLKAKANYREFTGMVIDRLGQYVEEGEDSTVDPETILNDKKILAAMYERKPRLIGLGNKLWWAVTVPRKIEEPKDETPSPGKKIAKQIMSFLPGNIGDTAVVTDADKIAEVNSYLLSHPDLLRAELADNIVWLQLHKRQELEHFLGGIASKKYKEKEKEINQRNFEMRAHLFELLLKEAQEKGVITIIEVFRDNDDIRALKGEATPRQDSVGSESGSREFRVTAENDMLVFTFKYRRDFESDAEVPTSVVMRIV